MFRPSPWIAAVVPAYRVDTRWSLLRSIILEHPPAADHSADQALPGQDVLADGGVDVQQDEDRDDPHTPVVPHANILALTDEGDDPAEEPVLPGPQSGLLRIEGKAGEDHHDAADGDDHDHEEVRQRVVADVLVRLPLQKGVPADLVPEIVPEALTPDRQGEELMRPAVAHRGPIETEDEADHEDIGGGKVGETDVAHQVVVAGLSGQRGKGVADEITGHHQNGDGQGIDPMPGA